MKIVKNSEFKYGYSFCDENGVHQFKSRKSDGYLEFPYPIFGRKLISEKVLENLNEGDEFELTEENFKIRASSSSASSSSTSSSKMSVWWNYLNEEERKIYDELEKKGRERKAQAEKMTQLKKMIGHLSAEEIAELKKIL